MEYNIEQLVIGSKDVTTISIYLQGKVQFFIDALDRAVINHNETEAIINRFPIDLQLELGANFTERRTYTGIYNVTDQGFDLSFRVQCSTNFYGSMCTEYCEPILGVYEGKAVCVQNSTNCEIPTQTIVSYQGQSNTQYSYYEMKDTVLKYCK